MNIKSTAFIFLIMLLQSFYTAASPVTKGDVDYMVATFRSTLISSMKSKEQDGCNNHTYEMLATIDDAHQLFMSDQTVLSILKALKLLEATEVFSRNSFCPYAIIPRARIAPLYMRYYLEQNNRLSPPPSTTHSINHTYTNDDQSYLSSITFAAHRTLLDQCNATKKCSPSYQKILDAIALLNKNINEGNDNLKSVIRGSLYLNMLLTKGLITESSVVLQNTLIDIRNRLYNILRITQKYVYLEEPLSLSDGYQLKLLQYALNEKKISSTCHVIIYNYFDILSSLDSTDMPEIYAMVFAQAGLFEALYEDNNKGTVYARNKECSTKESEIIALPYDFSKDVKKYISTMH